MSGFKQIEREKLPSATEITCPRCIKTIPVVTHAQAVNIGCSNCEYILQQHNGSWTGFKNLSQFKHTPDIPLWSKGRIKDVLYQVVGFVVYQEARAPYSWREYILFSPIQGYAFLSEYDGHWIFFRYLADLPLKETHATSIQYGENEYKLYHRYSSKVKFAVGEFPWKILESVSKYAEYIAPPYMLTQEVSADETCWMQGEHMEPEEIRDIFGILPPLPERIGVGAVEPFSRDLSYKKVTTAGAIACGILLILFILSTYLNGQSTLADQSYAVPLSENSYETTPPAAIPGPTFELNSFTGSSNLEFEIFAPVSNDWFALGITLINTKTNKAYDFELGTEFYEGYTDGSNWTEGSTMNDVDLSAMPDGTYTVILQPYRSGSSKVDTFRIWVREGVPLWSNFWIILLLLALIPVIQWIRHESHEKSRWMNSDYSTY